MLLNIPVMKKSAVSGLVMAALVIMTLLAGCSGTEKERIETGGPETVSFKVLPFHLSEVTLLNGPFLHATELDEETLLNYDPDRLLSRFYTEAGLRPKAAHYMGWENESLAGHSLGHYLSACSMMYRTTGDSVFLNRVRYIVSELKKIQEANGDGYIGAFANGQKVLEQEVAKGDIRSHGFDLNGLWSPFYTVHKIMAGLRDAWHLCGDTTALGVEKRFAGWVGTIVMPLTDKQVQDMLRCEYGGISETLADLYADTKDSGYLKLSEIFYDRLVLDSLKARKDVLPGRHCNTNIPKLIALSRLYELTGDTSDRGAAEFFWHTVVNHHSYVTGGNGDNEYFGPEDQLRNRLDEGTTESCNVYNMLKLSEHLFEWSAAAKVADFYERALFNHILASQNPETGNVTYNLSLDMGGFKDFQDPYWFTCCIGTGMENHAKYSRNIYYHNNSELYVFQYIASSLKWEQKGITLTQETSYPEEQSSHLIFTCDKPAMLTLMIRYPHWAKKGIEISVNGKKHKVSKHPGSFIPVTNMWKTGDVVDISIPFSLRLEPMPDDKNRVAVMYGPLVLAGDLGPVIDTASKDAMYVPVMMTGDRDPSSWMKPVEGSPNTFTTVNTGRPRDIVMRPFYTFYKRRYSVYWDLFTEKSWKAKQEEYNAERERFRKMKEAEIDFVQPGEMQPERNHNFIGEKTGPGTFKERAFREARGGWFSFNLKVKPDMPNSLVVEYWGGFPGAKTFDILINNRKIATENISNKKDGQFLTLEYDIPGDITAGRSMVTVKFEAHPGNTAGPVFGIRTIKRSL